MWNEISAHLYKQVKIAQRWPGELMHIFVFPMISIASLGILAHFVITQGAPVETFYFVFVGVVVWNVYELSERTMAYGVMADIFNGSLKHSFLGNSTMVHYIAGNAIYGFLGSVIGIVMAILGGIYLFGFNILDAGIFLALNLGVLFIFGVGMGLILTGILLMKGVKYMAGVWLAPGLVLLFSGIYYPIEVLPPIIKEFSLILPSTHSIISLRSAFFGVQSVAWSQFFVGAVLTLVVFVLGAMMFRFGLDKARETGFLTKH